MMSKAFILEISLKFQIEALLKEVKVNQELTYRA
jgi:hypothetical protein